MTVPAPVAALVAGGACWGIELEPVWRVLAVTVEPAGGGEPVQVLCSPVSVLLASLTRQVDGRTSIATFPAERLPEVSARLGGARIGPDPFGAPEPRPGAWGPRLSLEGRSSASDGTGSTLLLDLVDGDARLRLFARFDVIEVRAADGTLVAGVRPADAGGARGDEAGGPIRTT